MWHPPLTKTVKARLTRPWPVAYAIEILPMSVGAGAVVGPFLSEALRIFYVDQINGWLRGVLQTAQRESGHKTDREPEGNKHSYPYLTRAVAQAVRLELSGLREISVHGRWLGRMQKSNTTKLLAVSARRLFP